MIRRGREGPRLVWLAVYAGAVRGIGDGDCFGVFVLGMMLFSVYLLVFLEVLRPLERLLTYFADVGLERGVDCMPREGCDGRGIGRKQKGTYL